MTTDQVTKMSSSCKPLLKSLYEESSQYRHWRFSKQQLATLRRQMNERSIEVVKKNVELEKEAAASLPSHINTTTTKVDISTQLYLTAEDEQSLVSFYLTLVPRTCQGIGFPEIVEATAMSYLKRFYLWNTCMDYHPKDIMPCCIFLSLKTENYLLTVNDFIQRFSKLTAEQLLKLEFTIAQSLKFEFQVHHAHTALKGFWLDVQTLPDIDIPTLEHAAQTAHSHVKASRLTSLELTYTPSQIALAALSLANPSLVSKYLAAKGGMDVEALTKIVNEINEVLGQQGVGKVDMEKVKEVDRRLRLCSNPEKVVGSALYLKLQAEKEAAEAEKQAKRAEKAKAAREAEADFFGGELGASSRQVVIPSTLEAGSQAEVIVLSEDDDD